MNDANYLIKKKYRKNASRKGQRFIRTLSRTSLLTDLFIKTIFSHILLLLYGILFFKFTVKLTKPSKMHAWSTVRKFLMSTIPTILTENTEKDGIKTWSSWLVATYLFVLSDVNFADVSSTRNSPRFNPKFLI